MPRTSISVNSNRGVTSGNDEFIHGIGEKISTPPGCSCNEDFLFTFEGLKLLSFFWGELKKRQHIYIYNIMYIMYVYIYINIYIYLF